MYFPYFRGKQYELISIRENAKLMAENGIIPIIEPVKESLGGLERAFEAIKSAEGRSVLVINPFKGDFSNLTKLINEFDTIIKNDSKIEIGIALTEGTDAEFVTSLFEKYSERKIALIHAGFIHPKDLVGKLGDKVNNCSSIFLEKHCSRLYRKNFGKCNELVLIRDGFKKQRNSDYPELESFSDLHVTYEDEGVRAFGDFLMVGSDYAEGGGPAYVVAIHITYIDPEQDYQMFIWHFKSENNNSPKDPAGKFAEALSKLVKEVNKTDSLIFKSVAVKEYIRLHQTGHFPGLGSVKKLSMNHHLETLVEYFKFKKE